MNSNENALAGLRAKIHDGSARVGILGLGYVGLPLAVTIARSGLRVTGFDIDPAKIDALARAESYVGTVSGEDIARMNDEGRHGWTSDFDRLSRMDIFVICVPTPLTGHREPDLSYVIATTEEIARRLPEGSLVILESR